MGDEGAFLELEMVVVRAGAEEELVLDDGFGVDGDAASVAPLGKREVLRASGMCLFYFFKSVIASFAARVGGRAVVEIPEMTLV